MRFLHKIKLQTCPLAFTIRMGSWDYIFYQIWRPETRSKSTFLSENTGLPTFRAIYLKNGPGWYHMPLTFCERAKNQLYFDG